MKKISEAIKWSLPSSLGDRATRYGKDWETVETWPLEKGNRILKVGRLLHPILAQHNQEFLWFLPVGSISYLGVDVMAISRQLNIDNQSMKSQLISEPCMPKART